MRKTHSFEIVGIGEFNEYPAKVKEVDYPSVSKSGEALVKKAVQVGIPSEFAYMDKNGVVYEKKDVFYNVNGKLVQKVNRTEKISSFKVVEKGEAMRLLESSTSFLLPSNLTTLELFKKQVGDGMALKFVFKKSSVGFKFVNAYLFEDSNELVMVTGLGNRNTAMELFKAKRNELGSASGNSEVVEVSAEDVTPTLD